MNAYLKGAATAAILAAGTIGGASAQQLRVATGLPGPHGFTYGIERFAEYLQEHAGLNSTIYLLDLLTLPEIPEGVRDGIADVGVTVTSYRPADFSETNMMADLSMVATSGNVPPIPAAAMSGAMMEYILLNCEDCVAEYTAMNQVFVANAATSPYVLLCREPVENSVAGMRGLRLRSGAANFGRWAEDLGGIKVSMPGNEIYEAMSQGVVDCSMLAASTLVEQSLADVTRQVIRGVPGGVFAATANNAVNLDVWRGLSVEQRQAYLRGSAEMAAHIVFRYEALDADAYAAAAQNGLPVENASAELMEHYNQFVSDDLAVIAESFGTQYGVENAAEKIQIGVDLIHRWQDLTRNVTTVEELAEIYWNEILSRVDAATYPEG